MYHFKYGLSMDATDKRGPPDPAGQGSSGISWTSIALRSPSSSVPIRKFLPSRRISCGA